MYNNRNDIFSDNDISNILNKYRDKDNNNRSKETNRYNDLEDRDIVVNLKKY